MRKHRRNLPPVLLKPVRLIIVGAISLIVLLSIVGYLGKILKALDYFMIKDIITNEKDIDLSDLKGQNIFGIDLKKESRDILEAYPTYRNIRLVRVFPNRLFVYFQERQPLALVKLYRYFCVDEQMVLFAVPDEIEESNLPVILGLETKIFGPKPGKKYNLKELILALNIIKEAKKNRAFKNYPIKKIDVANLSNAALFINDLEIKVGQEDISDTINILGGLLIQLQNDLNKIKYIDLRFKEPVIKYKN